MTLKEFINHYDKEGSVVLLEGKRKVPEADREKLIALGRRLAAETKNMIFRNGNAEGADELFGKGVATVDKKRLQVITPYTGHRKTHTLAAETIALDKLDIAGKPELLYLSKKNKKTEKLIEPYLSGERNSITLKAAYIIRDTVKVVGTESISPAVFGIFYDDPANPRSGGTGHTMNVCRLQNIPVADQKIWMRWLNEYK